MLPSLLALYDTLNDDDDEIREAGAYTVSVIVGTSLVPLAASRELLSWMVEQFGETDAFSKAVLERITGFDNTSTHSLQSVDKRLTKAMERDDSLFIEEEQNLYIDEVRETIAWTSLLFSNDGPHWDDIASQISSWALEGLDVLIKHAETEDGPFGWTSKPKVFEICMGIILAAQAVFARYVSSLLPAEGAQIEPGVKDPNNAHNIEGVARLIHLGMVRLHEIGSRNNLHPVLLDHLEHSNVFSPSSSSRSIEAPICPTI